MATFMIGKSQDPGMNIKAEATPNMLVEGLINTDVEMLKILC